MTTDFLDIAGRRPSAPAVKGVSLWQGARRRLVRNRAAMGGLIVLIVITLLAIFGPWLSPHAFDDQFYDEGTAMPPDFAHGFYFGTDDNGRDLFVRTMYGSRISLTVGLISALVSLIIGVAYGATAGFLGGSADNVMMRIVDTIYSLPFIFFVILLMTYFGHDIYLIFIAIGAVEWLDMARIVRGQTMALKHREFIEAAHAFGVSGPTIIRRHIIPNLLGPVMVFMTLTVPKVILIEAFLSFLGLGVQEPLTSWGVLIGDGAAAMESAPHMMLFPASFLVAAIFALNFLGDGLRDALDPKDR
jgi:oligopeptide transport system permease protein